MKISLSIAIYKSTDFLNRVLESVKRQSLMPDQLIITEDGEFADNKKLVDEWRKKLNIPINHITQKDIGNRKPLALNKAVLASEHEYMVFIDGDVVLHKDFILAHKEMADEKAFLTGRRVELSKSAADYLTAERIAAGYLEKMPFYLLWDSIAGETYKFWRFFKTPKFLLGLFDQTTVHDIRGCNFSVHKKHLIAINGFGNDFSGAYGEDSDVEYRLKFLGLKMKSVKGEALQYHLWHKTQTKDLANQERLDELVKRGVARTENGLQQSSSIQ
ncbi:MAG: glycosyltransferase [Oligoflexia bacterium]|nr:glycosyltransferase [Oligoflexia bacterium]